MEKYGHEFMLLDNKQWVAPITENPKLGSTEIWNLINLTTDSHPIQLHLIEFQILDRRDFDVEKLKKKKLYITQVLRIRPNYRNKDGRIPFVQILPSNTNHHEVCPLYGFVCMALSYIGARGL